MDDRHPLRQIRHDRLLSIKRLAKATGVCMRTISSIEHGKRCRIDTQRRILKGLRLPFERRREMFPEGM